MRMLVVFEKGELLRHTGHLDLVRAMQRALRRSELPIAYSQGFNPHILNAFASALSVGVSGEREIMDVKLSDNCDAEVFKQQLNDALPPALRVKEVIAIEDTHPAPMSLLAAADYTVTLDHIQAEKLTDAVALLLAKQEIQAMRKTKSGIKPCDIRPMIYVLEAEGNTLHMRLALTEQATCKPQMVIDALCAEAAIDNKPHCMIVRNAILGKNEAGQLVPLETL